MARQKRHAIAVRREAFHHWVVYCGTSPVAKAETQGEAKRKASAHARKLLKNGEWSQVRVYGLDGRIKTEWTYGGDPRRRKG